MSVDFLEGPVFVSEVAAFSVRAEFFPVELATILGLVFFVETGLCLGQPVDFSKLFLTMGVLALEPIPTEAYFGPVLTHFSLVFFGIHQRHHLTILHEVDLLLLIEVLRGIELSRVVHLRRLSGGNERGAFRWRECEGVGGNTHVLLSLALCIRCDWRNWSELGVGCRLRDEALECRLHGEL